MKKIIRTIDELKELFIKVKSKLEKKEAQIIEIEPLFNKRTNKQLRSYWLLIKTCKFFMNSHGNDFTDEEVSYYFKIKSGHYTELDGVKLAKSISDKSLTTKAEMEHLINTILEFGVENGIDDCRIDSEELRSLLSYYE